jgi:hypothetical protein
LLPLQDIEQSKFVQPGETHMTRFFLIAALLAATASTAHGQSKVLVLASRVTDNEFIFGRNAASPPTRTQRVLSTANPALLGLDWKSSVLVAHSSVTTRFVTNSAYGSGGTTNHVVAGLTIDGNRYADSATPTTSPTYDPVADGVEIDGQGVVIKDCIIKQFWGNAVVLSHDQYLQSCRVQNSFTGIEVVSSDVSIGPHCIVSGCRDYGIRVNGAFGNIHSHNNHYYGYDRAGYITTAGYWASGDMYADASYGLYLEASGPRVSDCTFQHNATASIVCTGAGSHLDNNVIDLQRVTNWSDDTGDCYGVIFGAFADYSEFNGGTIHFTTYAHGLSTPTGDTVTGIQCAADQVEIRCKLHDGNTLDAVWGIEITGAVNGVTFDVRTNGFHDAADQIVVSTTPPPIRFTE